VRVGIATEAPPRIATSLIDAFARERPDVETSVVQCYAGALLRDLRDGRLDGLVLPSLFGSTEFRSLRLGSEPWVVLAAPGHRLGSTGPVAAHELEGVEVVVTGHRDGAAYDRAVTEMLTQLGIDPVLHRGGPGPALHSAVMAGTAVALTTSSAAAQPGLVVRRLEPSRRIRFALLWRDETPAPALRELIRITEGRLASAGPEERPALASAA
jgi:DNA-binding transcriptional LysR family regulator